MTLRHGDRAPVLLPIDVPLRSARRAMLGTAEALARGNLDAASALADELQDRAEHELFPLPLEGEELDVQVKAPLTVAAAYARLLVDLHTAGWRLEVDGALVYGLPPTLAGVRDDREMRAAKAAVRGSMMGRVREAVASPSTARLVAEVEPAIGALMADPAALARTLERDGASGVRPYLQPARRADGVDQRTGLPLFSIFRYLRFWWSFPYRDTPGRSLPFLIRDAGQPGHPVCGLLNLASPVLRMAQRDDALGLTHRWLRELAVALIAFTEGPAALGGVRSELDRRSRAARAEGKSCLTPATLWPQLASLLGVDDADRAARRLDATSRLERARAAATRVLEPLERELRAAIEGISFDDLGVSLEDALRDPAVTSVALRELGEQAARAWKEGRAGENVDSEDSKRLFKKKRANQLSRLLADWDGLTPVRRALHEGGDPLRALVGATEQGTAVASALGGAIESRKVRLMATQVADVSVCGAVPPYNDVLGGKLAALAALSRDVAAAYHDAYDGVASDIQSKMAGEEVRRPAELLALTTTSFYAVGSAQYNRLRLPGEFGGAGWSEVGTTAGHGTLHLSEALVALLARVLVALHGGRLISSKFGEGPSERLRKLRDGLNAIGQPSEDLLFHGFQRIVYLSVQRPLFPGAPEEPYAHHLDGPALAQVSGWWAARWAQPRLSGAIEALRCAPVPPLLSTRFPDEFNVPPGLAAAALVDDESDSELIDPGEDERWGTSFSEAFI